MEKMPKKHKVYEWTIENFSFWRKDISYVHLSTEPRSNMVQFDLFQGRRSSMGERKKLLWVNISNVSDSGRIKGDISLLLPDGTPIREIPVDREDDFGSEFFCALPYDFCELVAILKKNEAADRVTLRFRIENREKNVLHSRHSMFEVRTISTKIALSSILNSLPNPSERRVLKVQYPLQDGGTEKFKVIINEKLSPKITLMLESRFNREEVIFVRTRTSVLQRDGSVIGTEERDGEVLPGLTWTFSDSLTRNAVVLEELSILLELTVFPGGELKHLYALSTPFVDEVTARRPDDDAKEPELAVLAKDFSSLRENSDFSDLQLHCAGVSFPVHRSVLSARSPVFKTMLSSGMKEADSGSVDIEDLDPPTLSRFLSFMYSGTVDDLDAEGALPLYYAAEKYLVPTLKTICGKFLSANLSTRVVCDVLSLADTHGDQLLLSAAHSFILKNFTEVLMSEEWSSLMERDPLLVSKTVTGFGREMHIMSNHALKN